MWRILGRGTASRRHPPRRVVGQALSSLPGLRPSISSTRAIAAAAGFTSGTGALWPPYTEIGLLADGTTSRLVLKLARRLHRR